MLFRSADRGNLSDDFIRRGAADALITVEEMRARISAGRTEHIPTAMAICLSNFAPIPDWLSDAFLDSFKLALSGNVRSWDEIFGPIVRKGQHHAAWRKRRHKESLVTMDICREITENRRALDESLFEDVGRKHGLGKTLAAEYYYAFKRMADRSNAATARQHPDWGHVPHDEKSLFSFAYIYHQTIVKD